MNTAVASDDRAGAAAMDDGQSVADLLIASATNPQDPRPLAALGTLFARGGRLVEARVTLLRALALDPRHLDSLWGLYDIEQVLGNTQAALEAQRRAIALQPVIHIQPLFARGRVAAKPISVLMLCAPGPFQANTPLEYIADGSTLAIHKWFLTAESLPAELPMYDVLFTAIGHDPNAGASLLLAQEFCDSQSRPVINEPRLIPNLGRDALAARFAGSQRVHVAPVARLTRDQLQNLHIDARFLARPTASQAGDRLALLRNAAERDNYLASVTDVDAFYAMPFVDYRSQDGYYRKYRIVFIDGEPYPVHLAISPRWMVHYYNSPMVENAWMREEEEAFLRDITGVFHGLLGDALREIATALPFGYYAVDCGISPDGRLLLFEADTAMLVHMQDTAPEFAYKISYLQHVVSAVETMFARRAEPDPSRPTALVAFDNDLELDEPLGRSAWQGFAPDSTLSSVL